MTETLPIYSIITDEDNPPFILSVYHRHIQPRSLHLLKNYEIAFKSRARKLSSSAQINESLYRAIEALPHITVLTISEDGEYQGEGIIPVEIEENTPENTEK